MRIAQFSLLGVVLSVAVQAAGAEASAPLESTKQELRQLESTQKNRAGPTVPESVKLDTPTLDLGGAGNRSMPQWTERRKEDEERARRQKQRKDENWLINGVERLSREGTATTAATANESADLPMLPSTPDPEDPQYLLKLYNDQEKRSAAKEASPKGRATSTPDPFAPFLQNWLGTSPVRNQVLDQFRKNGDAVGVTSAPGNTSDFRAPGVAGTNTAVTPYETAAPPKSNPYLLDSGAPVQTKDMFSGMVPLRSVERSSPGPMLTPTTVNTPTPFPDTRVPAKGPPTSPADDKKYFPQLNRF